MSSAARLQNACSYCRALTKVDVDIISRFDIQHIPKESNSLHPQKKA